MVLKVDATVQPHLGFELNMICQRLLPCEPGPYTYQIQRITFNNNSIGQSRNRIRLVVVFISYLKSEMNVISKEAPLLTTNRVAL